MRELGKYRERLDLGKRVKRRKFGRFVVLVYGKKAVSSRVEQVALYSAPLRSSVGFSVLENGGG